MSLIAHASCPSCPSCSASAEVLTDDHGYLIGTAFACDVCSTWWVELLRQPESAGRHNAVIRDSIEKGARS